MDKYGDPTGRCIEASERIIEEIAKLGGKAKLIEGWVDFYDWEGCTDCSYDPHSWVEYEGLIIDVTGDQFNMYMYDNMPDIYIGTELPEGWCEEEPENQIDLED